MLIYENRKMKVFWCREIFLLKSISKLGVKMNFRMIMKNHAADPEIGFLSEILTKSILKPYDRNAAMPTA